jgi:hypothetical protein
VAFHYFNPHSLAQRGQIRSTEHREHSVPQSADAAFRIRNAGLFAMPATRADQR